MSDNLIPAGLLKTTSTVTIGRLEGIILEARQGRMSRFHFLSLVLANIYTFGVLKRSKCCFWLIFVGFYSVW